MGDEIEKERSDASFACSSSLMDLRTSEDTSDVELATPVLATIMSFVVSASDTTGLDKMRHISPAIKKAIDENLTMFHKGLILEVATHPEFPHDLSGIWYVSETHHNVPPDYEGTRPVLGFQF